MEEGGRCEVRRLEPFQDRDRLARIEAQLDLLWKELQAIRGRLDNGLSVDVAVLKEQMKSLQQEGEQKIQRMIMQALERIERNTLAQVEQTRLVAERADRNNRIAVIALLVTTALAVVGKFLNFW